MIKISSAIFKTFFLSLCIVANTHFAFAQTASILPPGYTQYLDSNGKPLSAGKVYNYVPNTTTLKTTWQDAAETIPNTNPVTLDAGGRAKILGDGSYRQIVKDRNGVTIWDAVTSSTGSGSSSPTATGDGDLVGTIKPWAGMTAPNQYAFAYGQEISRITYSALYTAITSSQSVFCNSGSPVLNGISDTTNFWVGMSVEISCVAAGFSTVVSKTASTVTLAANANVTTNVNATFFPWGRGNGTTTFNLPDLRGVIPAGNNNMGGVASSNLTTTYFGATNPNSIGALGGSQSTTLITANLPAYTPAGTITNGAITSNAPNGVRVQDNNNGGGSDFAGGIHALTNLNSYSYSQATSTFAGSAQGGTSTAFSNVQPTITTNYIIKITPDANSATASGVTSLGGMTGSISCGTGLLCTGNTISTTSGVSGISDFTSTIGLTPVSGVSTIAGRIDSAPALSQAIAPIWTNLHTFNGGLSANITGGTGPALITGPSATYYNVLGSGAAPFLLQLTQGSVGTPTTSINPTMAISRYEAIAANTEGGQNAALLLNVTGNNTSTIGNSSQVNGLTSYAKQIGTGDVAAGYFAAVHNGATLSGHHYASYGIFAVAQGNSGTNSAIAGNFIIDNNSGSDCSYATMVPGGTTCAEMGLFIQSIGANVASAGVLLYANLGKFDCGFCIYAGAVNTYAFASPGFNVTATGSVNLTTAANNITWTTPAANAGIDFGAGSIKRISSDGHIRYISQNNIHEFLGSAGAGFATTVAVGETGAGGILKLFGTSTGSASIITQAAAGTPILTLPNASGTFAISATSPIVLSATTGELTCPTCATTAGASIPSIAQGDLLYGSAVNVLSALAKNTSATRYLANTGTSNNPAWAQVDLTNGVTQTLPVGNGGTGITSLGTGVATWLGTPSSANLAAAVTDETGSGALVFGTTPTIATPVINGLPTGTGVATANTASTLVSRDASGNFAAGAITANSYTAAGSNNLAINSPGTFILFQFAGTNTFAANNTVFTPSNDAAIALGQSSLRWTNAWFSQYVVTSPVAVGSLSTCNATTAGARSAVTDSNAASFTAGIGAVVAAGGATKVPVYCDGTNWRIG